MTGNCECCRHSSILLVRSPPILGLDIGPMLVCQACADRVCENCGWRYLLGDNFTSGPFPGELFEAESEIEAGYCRSCFGTLVMYPLYHILQFENLRIQIAANYGL